MRDHPKSGSQLSPGRVQNSAVNTGNTCGCPVAAGFSLPSWGADEVQFSNCEAAGFSGRTGIEKGGVNGPERTWAVRVGACAMGAASLWAQVMVVRSGLAAFGGNELVIALLFGLWLAAVGTGAFTGGLLVRRIRYEVWIPLGCTFLLLSGIVFFEYFVARGLRGLLNMPAGECPRLWQIAAGTFITTVPISFFVGILFPLLSEARRAQSRGAGEVYALEAAGSLAAGCAGTYLFLAKGSEELLPFSAVCVLLLASCLSFRRTRFSKACAGLLLLWVVLGIHDLNLLKEWARPYRWHGLINGFHVAGDAESPYGHLAVLDREGQKQLYLDGQLAFAFPDVFQEEPQAHVAATEAVNLGKVVLISGPPGLSREFIKYTNGPGKGNSQASGAYLKELHFVRFDPTVKDLLSPFLSGETKKALSSEKVHRHLTDPRSFLRNVPEDSCGLILLALPEPLTAGLNRFYTVQFFREVKRALAPDGVLTFSVRCGIHLQHDTKLYAASFLKTLREVFEDVAITAGSTIKFFASGRKGVVTTGREELARRFEERKVPSSYFQKFYFTEHESFRPEMVEFTRKKLNEGLGKVQVETDSRPTLFLRRLVLFARRSGTSIAPFIKGVLSLKPWYVLPWALVPGVLIFLFRRKRSFPVVLAVGSTGVWAMSFQVLLLFSFQVACGSLYHKIGMLTGCFMCGLSLGALAGRRVTRPERALLTVEAAGVICAAATCFVTATASSLGGAWPELLLYIWVAVLGAVPGFEFSTANLALGLRSSSRDDRSSLFAALTDGADHIGACAGAVLCGLVLLPCLGIITSAVCLAMLKMGTLFGLYRYLKSTK